MATAQLSKSERLENAQSRIRELELSRDAMLSSIEGLKVLVSNERTMARVNKRRLATATQQLAEIKQQASAAASTAAQDAVEELARVRAQLDDRDAKISDAEKHAEDLSNELAALRDQFDARSARENDLADARRELEDVSARFKEREGEYRGIAAELESVRSALQQTERERDTVKHEISSLNQTVKERDDLAARVQQLNAELGSKTAEAEKVEKQLHDAFSSNREHVAEMSARLREETGKVTALSEAVSEVGVLRTRIKELENEADVHQTIANFREASDEDLSSQSESAGAFSKSFVKRKLFELKIARTVILEKDKFLKELRDDLAKAEARAWESEVSRKSIENHTASVEKELLRVQTKAVVTPSEGQAGGNRSCETETNLVSLEGELCAAQERLAAAEVEIEEKNSRQKELLTDLENRMGQALSEKQRAKEECAMLQASLADMEKEVSRLETANSRQSSTNEYLGSSSPCSLVTDVESTVHTSGSSQPLQSLADLEEAAAIASTRSKAAKEGVERQAIPSAISAPEATIDALQRSLQESRLACDETSRRLEDALLSVSEQEATVRKLRNELATRVEECESLQTQIQEELKPALEAANELLEERQQLLNNKEEELVLHKETADKTRSALEVEIGSTLEQLQNSLTSLNSAQDKVLRSEQKGADLEDKIAQLVEERGQNLRKLDELEQDCEHRRQSLHVMQERLVHIEEVLAEREQAALDATEEKNRLERILSQVYDRQDIAERRAVRKDDQMYHLETRARELEQSHAVMKEHVAEKAAFVVSCENELHEAQEVLKIKEEALQDHAKASHRREAMFESLAAELRGAVQTRDRELGVAKEDLLTIERRARSLSEAVASATSKLKMCEQELASLQQQHSDSEAENRRKDIKLREADEVYAHLKAEYQAAQKELGLREKQVSSQLTAISEKGGKIAALRAEKTELENTIREVRAAFSAEKSRFESQIAVTRILEDDVAKLRANLATCEDDLSIRSTEADSLSRSLTSAQTDLVRLENAVGDKDEELKSRAKVIRALETALERSKQQVAVLESHLDGHDSLLKDCREKEETLSIRTAELGRAVERIEELEHDTEQLQGTLTGRAEEIESLSTRMAFLETGKAGVDKELERAQEARDAAEHALNTTTASLAALENSTTEEIADLNATITSLRKVLDEKESSLNSASETITQSSIQNNLTKEQLIDSRTRGDRLFSRLTATEYELASKKESLATLEVRLREVQETLKGRDEEIERLEKILLARDQALSAARSKLSDMTKKASSIAKGEVLSIQTKLEAKEKAIANLHNWCCFINGKLHAAEKALSERDMDLDVSSTAFKKLEAQLNRQNEIIAEKESQMRKLESASVVENSELRSRIQSLQSYVEEVKSELERTKLLMSSKGSDTHSSLVAVEEELRKCKSNLKDKEIEMSEVLARRTSLQETVKRYERDLAASEKTIESLTLDLGRLRSETSRKRDAEDNTDKSAADEVSNVRAETGYLLVELRRAEAELSAANENARTWQQKVEELQPLAESTLEAQRAVEIVSSQLSLSQKDAKQRIDLLETQLKEAERERDAAERDCSTAIADYSAMRARLTDSHGLGPVYGHVSAINTLCTVTFTLEGRDAPSAEVMVYILGGDATLGQWNPSRRLPVRVVAEGQSGVLRKCDVVLPGNLSTAYKYVADASDGSLVWEGGENRVLELSGNASQKLQDYWRSPL